MYEFEIMGKFISVENNWCLVKLLRINATS